MVSIKESPRLLWPGWGMTLREQKLCFDRKYQGELFLMGATCHVKLWTRMLVLLRRNLVTSLLLWSHCRAFFCCCCCNYCICCASFPIKNKLDIKLTFTPWLLSVNRDHVRSLSQILLMSGEGFFWCCPSKLAGSYSHK